FQLMRLNIHLGFFAADFRGNVWDARHTLLAGQNPYPSLDTLRALAGTGVPFTYPPLILWLALPFSPLPLVAAEAIWSVGLVVGVAAALRLVGVRDWRCFGIVLGSVPVLQGLSSGSPTLLFVPLL